MIDKNTFDGSLMTKGQFFKKARIGLYQNEVKQSVKKYINPVTNGIFADMVRERNCLVCGSDQKRIIFYKNCFPHAQCNNCKFVYVNSILKDDIWNC